ncbi:unnamed protein product [Brassica rapa]|uniref:Uncharacterized protein n=1 Tax=Brassica campestris TaxID=3711 RepID=A0A8D9CS36_BRACM|nr:unnamed protein product [Brassica rapa]
MLCSVQTLHIFGGQLGLVDAATVLAVKFRLSSFATVRWQQRKGEVAAALGIEGLESRLSMDSVDRGRGMPPRITLALKINCVRMAGFAGQREVPVTSRFAIHMCSSERLLLSRFPAFLYRRTVLSDFHYRDHYS